MSGCACGLRRGDAGRCALCDGGAAVVIDLVGSLRAVVDDRVVLRVYEARRGWVYSVERAEYLRDPRMGWERE